ncbi:MAG: hypothetical protein PHS41_10680, partial [Victivallaceae bacterium]|nr:hypothetical protein [Victivallaceae bacterium]
MMRNNRESAEQGAALLLALGMIALLLALVMVFVSNALIERQAAGYAGESTSGKSLALSALNRAVASMMIYQENFLGSSTVDRGLQRFGHIRTTSNLDAMYLDGIPLLFPSGKFYLSNSTNADSAIYDATEVPVTGGLNVKLPNWQYVSAAGSDGTRRLTGRYLYAVLPDMGQVSPDAWSRGKYNGFPQSPADFLDWIDSGSKIAQPATPSGTLTSFIHPEQNNLHNVKSFSRYNLFRYCAISDDQKYYNQANNLNGGWSSDSSIIHERYDLSALPSDITVSDLQTAIPYLGKIDSDEKIRNQIAANFINFFMNDTTSPVSDVPANTWTNATTLPTYTGNVKSYSLQALEINPSITVQLIPETYTGTGTAPVTAGKVSMKMQANINFRITLFSPYETPLAFSSVYIKFRSGQLNYGTAALGMTSSYQTPLTDESVNSHILAANTFTITGSGIGRTVTLANASPITLKQETVFPQKVEVDNIYDPVLNKT